MNMSNKRTFDSSFDNMPQDRKRRRKTEPATEGPISGNVADKLRIYGQAHNAVETRVYELEKLARPYQEFEKKTRRGIHLMQQVREEVTSTREEAMGEFSQAVDSAKAEYSSYVKKVVAGCVELSTNRLALILIKRIEDGDVVKPECLDRLRSLIAESEQAENAVQGRQQAKLLPSPPTEGEAIVPHIVEVPGPPAAETIKLQAPAATPTIETSHTAVQSGATAGEGGAAGSDGMVSRASRTRKPKTSRSAHQENQTRKNADEPTSLTLRRTTRKPIPENEPAGHEVKDHDGEVSSVSKRSDRAPKPLSRKSKFPQQPVQDDQQDEDEDKDEDEDTSSAPRRSRRAQKPSSGADFGFVSWTEAKEYKKRHRKH